MKKLLIALCVTFYGCETVVDLDVESGSPKLVLNGIINPDSAMSVGVSLTKPILDNEPFEVLEDATVNVYENDKYIGQLELDNTSFYTNKDLRPQKGLNYRIEVSKEGFENVVGETIIPVKSASISNAKVDSIKREDGFKLFSFQVTIEDIPGENYYEFALYAYKKIREYNWDTQQAVQVDSILVLLRLNTEDLGIEEFQTSINNGYVISDKLFTGEAYTLSFESTSASLSGNLTSEYTTFLFVLRHVNKDYYMYQRSKALHFWVEGDPFAEPVPVHNNIRNGLGIFAGYNQTIKEVRIK